MRYRRTVTEQFRTAKRDTISVSLIRSQNSAVRVKDKQLFMP